MVDSLVRLERMRTVTYLTRRNMIQRGALALMGGAMLSRAGWLEASELPLVRPVTLRHPGLPRPFDGLRILQIADAHAGVFMPPERLSQARVLVESLEPDVVVFSGDQLDRRAVDAEIFVHGFAGIDAPLGVYGVLGNHDHMSGPTLATTALEAVGATPLVNDAATIERAGSRILIAGVDDLDASPPHLPDFTVVQREADFRILLCHQPNGWEPGRQAGADITLSGHTHGGQIAFPTRGLNVARLATPFVAGAYIEGNSLLYVSRGIGVGAVPLRFGSPPEIDIITLTRELPESA